MSRKNCKPCAGPPFRPRRFFFATAWTAWRRIDDYLVAVASGARGPALGPGGHQVALSSLPPAAAPGLTAGQDW